MRNLANNVKVIRALNAVVAGTSDQTSSVIDTAGYEGVMFLVSFGAITSGAVTKVKAQQGAQSGGGDLADLEGTSITVADDDDNQVVVLDIAKPQERYVACVVDRGTQNAVIDGIVAVLYGGKNHPDTNDSATVVSRETHVSPDEGTA